MGKWRLKPEISNLPVNLPFFESSLSKKIGRFLNPLKLDFQNEKKRLDSCVFT